MAAHLLKRGSLKRFPPKKNGEFGGSTESCPGSLDGSTPEATPSAPNQLLHVVSVQNLSCEGQNPSELRV